jgi:hypothetical protein
MSVNFTNFGAVLDTVPAATLTVNGTSVADNFSYTQGSVAGNSLVTVANPAASNNALSVEFSNKAAVALNGQGGGDTFSITPVAGLPPVAVDAGTPGGSLTVNAPAANQFVVVLRNSATTGTVRSFTAAVELPAITYTNITSVIPNVNAPPGGPANDLILGPATTEPNDTPAQAVPITTFPAQVLHNVILDNVPDNQDFFRVVAQTTGTLDIQAAFRTVDPALLPGGGALSAEVQDTAGNVIAPIPGSFARTSASAGLRFRIPAVAGQTYFVRVFRATAAAFNGYDLSVTNPAAPVPTNVTLMPPASTTSNNQPTLFVTVDDASLFQDPGSPPNLGPIPILFNTSPIVDGGSAGFRVGLFDSAGHHTLDPNDPTFIGFAQTDPLTPHLYELTVGSSLANGGQGDTLANGPHSITARVQIIDPADQRGFGGASTALSLTVGLTPNQCYVSQIYRDLLGREVDPFGLSLFAGALDSGAATRAQVAFDITISPEYQNLILSNLYTTLLHRPIDAVGQSGWSGFLAGGGTLEQVEAFILASPEYFQLHGGTNMTWLDAVYLDVLRRGIDTQGQTIWGNALSAGASRLSVASGILGSLEADLQTVANFYRRYLGREPEAAGLMTFTSALQAGLTNEMVLADILGSPEYFQRNCQM